MRLRTPRLVVRDLAAADLDDVHRILDLDLQMDDKSRELRARWLDWTVLDYEFRRRAHQPGYGEYGVALRDTDELVGLVGLVPSLMPFGLLPAYGGRGALAVPEVGMFWAVATEHQRRGYAAEAARALIDFGFTQLNVARLVATTDRDNVASAAVMRSLGMTVAEHNGDAPFYLQVVGWLDNPDREPDWPSG
ncbi:MAG: GNAT family N-acetyltransferase [Actinomycetota bacterium]|nr:GNAT family N-acetyltransferase [Actinomycetota bacterium]